MLNFYTSTSQQAIDTVFFNQFESSFIQKSFLSFFIVDSFSESSDLILYSYIFPLLILFIIHNLLGAVYVWQRGPLSRRGNIVTGKYVYYSVPWSNPEDMCLTFIIHLKCCRLQAPKCALSQKHAATL